VKQEDIERLRQNEGKVVKINCLDGELLEAKIIHVDDEYHDAIYDLVSSTTPEKYKPSFIGTTSWIFSELRQLAIRGTEN
jgi:hypothetical protein